MSSKFDHLFKILVIGESAVGKTCLLLRFTEDTFTANHLATIVINIENKLIKLQIWDTAGQDRFKSITKTYYKGAHGILLVYDVTERESFLKIQHWMKQIETHAKGNVCKVLVGNKCDKTERQISEEEGKKCACDNHINFYETSAKTGLNVDEVFMFITKEIVKNLTPPEAKNININDPKVDQEHNKCCK